MQDHWSKKSVDLSILASCVVQFFEQKKFLTSMKSSEKEHHIIARPRQFHGIVEEINVYIIGEPEDFKVKFVAGSRSNAWIKLGTITSLLGGGVFLVKGLKSQEALEKLEKEFWDYVNKTAWSLANSFPKG